MNEVEKIGEFSFWPEYLEMDPESYDGAAAEELEFEKKEGRIELHQILRIRAEDLHLREDHIGERLKEKIGVVHLVLFSRPILPASPLGGKAAY